MTVNIYQTGIDSFIELLYVAGHSHKSNRAAHNATEAEHSPRNEDMYTHTHTPTIRSNQTEHKDYHKEYRIESKHVSTDLYHSTGTHPTELPTHTHQHTSFFISISFPQNP